MAYVKLFGSILDSTIWDTSPETRVVWITMLAMADRDGVVEASIPGLAKRAGVSRAACEEALAIFAAPDKDSRTQAHGGRRIAALEGGWSLLNYELYRDKSTAEERAEKNAARQQRFRERQADRVARNAKVTPVTENDAGNPLISSQKKSQIRSERESDARVSDADARVIDADPPPRSTSVNAGQQCQPRSTEPPPPRETLPERPADPPADLRPDFTLAVRLARAWLGDDQADPHLVLAANLWRLESEAAPKLRLHARRSGDDVLGLFVAAIARYQADPGKQRRGVDRRLGLFLDELEQWLQPSKARPRGLAPVPSLEDFAEMQRQIDAGEL